MRKDFVYINTPDPKADKKALARITNAKEPKQNYRRLQLLCYLLFIIVIELLLVALLK
ncbi:TPA: hypothetical protein KTX14_002237 [Enterococcus faecium]|nr:hypothetical protein [Enterococcus faecium]HAZ9429150.1 hypothetical protein [Enterococcus faecium]HAZ9581204.1 hypothetical protein [Enterococcus faecium]HAZ9618856.1 hypothetical protein [Enterococcus faecium]HAZ9630721.1 hypothetical protein [Enterococcus faecium]